MATTGLSRTCTAGDDQKGTLSFWCKKSENAREQYIVGFGAVAGDYTQLSFMNSDTFHASSLISGSAGNSSVNAYNKNRDPSAWYHFVVGFDSTQVTATDRVKLYINGNQILDADLDNNTYPTQDAAMPFNKVGQLCTVGMHDGSSGSGTGFFNGIMAHVHWIDGTQYAASAFGSFDATSGIWVPNTGPSVTYGTNGFFLKFASGALGTDSSGEGNNMAATGTMTATKDDAQNNFCTLNPLAGDIDEIALSNGNLTTVASASTNGLGGTLGMVAGKWYWEVELNGSTSGNQIGIIDASRIGCNQDRTPGETPNNGFIYSTAGYVYNNGVALLSGLVTATTGDIISMALDITNLKIYFYKNNVLINTGGTTITADLTYLPAGGTGGGSERMDQDYNFGNGYFGTTSHGETNADDAGIGLFKYDVPTGYYALCTNNISTYG